MQFCKYKISYIAEPNPICGGNNIIQNIEKIYERNHHHLNLSQLIILLYTKIIETSTTYYEFAKKSIFLCKFNNRHLEAYSIISDIVNNGIDIKETTDKIFEIIMNNYNNDESDDLTSSQNYYNKYMKYKNKYSDLLSFNRMRLKR